MISDTFTLIGTLNKKSKNLFSMEDWSKLINPELTKSWLQGWIGDIKTFENIFNKGSSQFSLGFFSPTHFDPQLLK